MESRFQPFKLKTKPQKIHPVNATVVRSPRGYVKYSPALITSVWFVISASFHLTNTHTSTDKYQHDLLTTLYIEICVARPNTILRDHLWVDLISKLREHFAWYYAEDDLVRRIATNQWTKRFRPPNCGFHFDSIRSKIDPRWKSLNVLMKWNFQVLMGFNRKFHQNTMIFYRNCGPA